MSKQKVGGTIAAGAFAAVLTGAVAFGAYSLVDGPAAADPEPTVQVVAVDPASMPYTNGLAGEQEAAAAAEVARLAAEAEAARVAAEAEAARIAAEQAEAERVAAEQAAQEAAEQAAEDAPVYEPEAPSNDGPVPGTQVHTICQVLEDGTQVPCQH